MEVINFEDSTPELNAGERITDAGIVRRTAAFLIDNILLFLLYIFLLSCFFEYFNILKFLTSWKLSTLIFISIFFYQVILLISEALWAGRTPGKYTLNITVKTKDGDNPAFSQLLIRNFLRCTYLTPFFFIIPDLICYFLSGNRRIGDLLAGTRVIKLN